MYPDHLPILFQFNYALSECTVDIHISLPQFLPPQIIFEIIKALEVVEEGPQHCLMEIEELFNCRLVEKNWHAAIVFEHFGNFLGLTVVLGDDTRPPYPDNLYHLPLFSQFKHCWIKQ